MTEITRRAYTARKHFVTRFRGDGTGYVTLTEDAPDWVHDLVHQAHRNMDQDDIPDDVRCSMIQDALDAIEDGQDMREFADDGDIYMADLIEWLGSHPIRVAYVEQARDTFGEYAASLKDELRQGQYLERRDVFESVYAELERLVNAQPDEGEEA